MRVRLSVSACACQFVVHPRHRCLQARAYLGIARVISNHAHITRTGRKDTWSPAYSICVHRHTYSVQCSDKICFLQLHMKCGIAKSCPGTHTALQVPMTQGNGVVTCQLLGSTMQTEATACESCHVRIGTYRSPLWL